ncbi:hypothetical protein BpHYR1_022068, partial [Brachionus plicatilis]
LEDPIFLNIKTGENLKIFYSNSFKFLNLGKNNKFAECSKIDLQNTLQFTAFCTPSKSILINCASTLQTYILGLSFFYKNISKASGYIDSIMSVSRETKNYY